MVNGDVLLFGFGLRTGDELLLPLGPEPFQKRACVPVKALFHLNNVQLLSKEPQIGGPTSFRSD